MKHISQWTKYLAAMAVVFFALFIINMGILAGIHGYTREEKLSPEISEIAAQLSENENTYIMSEIGKEKIDELEGFAMLLGDKGEILWEYSNGVGVPAEILKGLNHKLNDKELPEHRLGFRVVKKIAGKYHWKIRFESELGKGFCCSIII